jgi:hypothetical protein
MNPLPNLDVSMLPPDPLDSTQAPRILLLYGATRVQSTVDLSRAASVC